MSTPAPPSRPAPLPNPVCDEAGRVSCNEPLIRDNEVVGYCCRFVKRQTQSGWRRPRALTHRGPHRIEWWSA